MQRSKPMKAGRWGSMKLDHQSMMRGAKPAPTDFPALVANLFASQSASPAAIAQVHHDVTLRVAHSREDAMTTLMQVRLGWRAAAEALGGSFHPGVANKLGAKGL